MTPRVFFIRHGETEWSLNGRHTGTTELPLTANGEKRIRATGQALVGNNRLIVPSKLAHVYVSPRRRAQRTLELLNIGCRDKLPWQEQRGYPDEEVKSEAKIQITEAIREWDYGDYEGLTSQQIREKRRQEGQSEQWDIWREGCPGGESPKDVTRRLDQLIHDIRTRFQQPIMDGFSHEESCGDILLVGHGHILRAFAMRWVNKPLEDNPALLLEAGGVGTLSYEHNNIEEPAILLGSAFVVEVTGAAHE
ncbi:phosphoglycerate mutase-like protein [Xylona heveae TC161]|uniref:Phosphoglycerate mutase-like protein n=1 Tax=Xylona heveae (strain CBS 132557 / TC161) TaxID=1328760 RepID=A0A165FGF0_XYLHT|nr:phosphoglycerate mutase-like protein [Xylona heveae TC161]KZF20947.1 phosphoglycerate mutase-like protein [Xylona heveae TC161]